MELSEVLKSIQPCNMDESYIFISYSAKDSQRVWQDVLKFQQMGYNVWLDEKNLDKTQPSWRNDALEAIRDLNCALMVFYVSRNSLVSQPCFSELACTVEDYTKAVHFGPVKFVAVDVEPIDDIVDFSRQVYMEIRKKDIPKADKTTQAITLNNCIEQFFNSNNEKVRVKPMDIPNRKMDYYEEITAAFPDDTQVLPVVEPEPVPEPVVIPEPELEPVPEPVVISEPVVIPDPVAVPAQESVVDPNQEHVVDAVPMVASESDITTVMVRNKEITFSRNKPYEGTVVMVSQSFIHVHVPEIGQVLVHKAKNLYGQSFINQKATVFISGTDQHGISLLGWNLHVYTSADKVGSTIASKFTEVPDPVVVPQPTSTSQDTPVVIPQPAAVPVVPPTQSKRYDALLEAYLAGESDIDPDAHYMAEPQAVPEPEPEAPTTIRIPLSPAMLAEHAMSAANDVLKKANSPFAFSPARSLSGKQLQNAMGFLPKQEKVENILGFLDSSLFGSGKDGVVLTKTHLYYKFSKKQPVDLATLENVQSEESHYLLLTYKNGQRERIFFSIYYLAVKAVLEVYIAHNKEQ